MCWTPQTVGRNSVVSRGEFIKYISHRLLTARGRILLAFSFPRFDQRFRWEWWRKMLVLFFTYPPLHFLSIHSFIFFFFWEDLSIHLVFLKKTSIHRHSFFMEESGFYFIHNTRWYPAGWWGNFLNRILSWNLKIEILRWLYGNILLLMTLYMKTYSFGWEQLSNDWFSM